MTIDINPAQIFTVSEDVVVREIDDELIIVPIASGIGDMEDELYTMNETGKAILNLLDGQHSLAEITQTLSEEYGVSADAIERDVIELVTELFRRKMLVQIQ